MDMFTLKQPSGMCSLSTLSKDTKLRCIRHNHIIKEDSRSCFCGAWVFVASYEERNKPHWRDAHS